MFFVHCVFCTRRIMYQVGCFASADSVVQVCHIWWQDNNCWLSFVRWLCVSSETSSYKCVYNRSYLWCIKHRVSQRAGEVCGGLCYSRHGMCCTISFRTSENTVWTDLWTWLWSCTRTEWTSGQTGIGTSCLLTVFTDWIVLSCVWYVWFLMNWNVRFLRFLYGTLESNVSVADFLVSVPTWASHLN